MHNVKKIYRRVVPGFIRDKIRSVTSILSHPNPIIPRSKAISNGMEFDVTPSTFWSIFNSGRWEPETREFYKKYVSPLKAVVDIGGWIGPTALIAYSNNPLRIHVVEADPVNYQNLKANCIRNYLMDKIDLHNICISDKTDDIVKFGCIDENIKGTSTKAIGGGGGG
jgi:hypothetical protein